MSSKLLSGEHADEARPIQWRQLGCGGSQAAQTPLQETAGPVGNQSNSNQPDAAHMVLAQQLRIQELEQQLAHKTRECYQQGHAAGQAAGAQQAEQELEPVMARLAATVQELSGLRRRVRAEAEDDAVRLAIAVARKILHREITVDADALLGLVKAAMQRVDSRELHRVRMHPEDIPALERHLQARGVALRLEVLADPSLERGGVVFETSRGNLDASIGTQLAEIERGFVDLVKRNRE